MATDLEQLVDMGFEKERANLALKKSGNLTGALDWLEKNADTSLEDLEEEEAAAAQAGDTADGAQAQSFVCNDCGKKLRNMNMAQFHAEKTGHDDFSESTEELAPLTEEEKKKKLEAMRAALAQKKAKQSVEDKLAEKRNEEIRKKHTKENDEAKELLQRKQQIKEAQQKKKEKQEDAEAKKRIKARIEADKAERKRKAEEEKAKRENPASMDPGAGAPRPSAVAAVQKSSSTASEARLRLQTLSGNVMKTFPADTTLFEVAHALEQENGTRATTFTVNFPKRVYSREDFGQTLKEAGFVPSAALIVQ
ncbi:hypothetical protein K470DRAFT_209109 [Piedraia hortae CBS 480.64]|uniref:UBX domain-containing protein n=1 Tax=Piedraia hortae CBS 480.64 TaxID=1314780 RepID=A0A6A7CAK0_9PEZI|nr:hypothetical protein K470DRAFT_209109 [Piedraia hortae CBS 480.64]